MSGAGAGHEYPSEAVSWLKRDVLLFNYSIGCKPEEELHFIYVSLMDDSESFLTRQQELHPKFATFPTYSLILPFKKSSQEVIDFYGNRGGDGPIPGVPALDVKRVVDGERHITFFKPLPTTSAGRKFEIRRKVLGVYDKGKPGTVVETQADLVDVESGEVYSRVVGAGFFVGQGGWGGPAGQKSKNYPPPENKEADFTYQFQTDSSTAHLYRLNGDYNPLHATPEPGKAMGFGGAIMHGLFSFNSTAHGLLKTLGASDPGNIKEFAARFASPVKPGDKLLTKIWRIGNKDADGFEDIRFVTQIEGGKVCLSNGRAKIRVVDHTSSKL